MQKSKRLILIASSLVIVLTAFPVTVHAFSLGDIVDNVKNFFTAKPPKELTIDSKIELAPGGDINKNGQIDAGDIVRFTYIITNTTDENYSFATLKTNINRKQLNFIHNITGTASLDDNDGKTISIPNFRIGANQIATITFDARVNYYTNEDPIIATEAEFVSEEKKSIAKSLKKEIKAKRMNKENIPGMMKQIETNQ